MLQVCLDSTISQIFIPLFTDNYFVNEYKIGIAKLPLHYGTAPRWLFSRMTRLAGGIVAAIVEEYSPEEFLRRISDPFWFQCFSCVLGFDWHSSGTTTVTCGALKQAIDPKKHFIGIAGGKGKAGANAPRDIAAITKAFDLNAEEYGYLSRMSAKIDNVAVQDFHHLYHHSFFITHDGTWAVIQQGMNPEERTARRYHWLSETVISLTNEPHHSILGDKKIALVLDMTANESEEARKITVDLTKENPKKLENLIKSIRSPYQRTLENVGKTSIKKHEFLEMPKTLNWNTVKKLYDFQPRNYEEFLSVKGVGPKTVRALALISELVYGEKPAWKDPIKYSFAVGGKDGVPYPVNRNVMDKTINILQTGIDEAKLGREEKLLALKRLKSLVNIRPAGG